MKGIKHVNRIKTPMTIYLVYLIIEKMNCVCIQLKTQCFQETYVISHNFFITEVKFVNNYTIYMIVTQQVI